MTMAFAVPVEAVMKSLLSLRLRIAIAVKSVVPPEAVVALSLRNRLRPTMLTWKTRASLSFMSLRGTAEPATSRHAELPSVAAAIASVTAPVVSPSVREQTDSAAWQSLSMTMTVQ